MYIYIHYTPTTNMQAEQLSIATFLSVPGSHNHGTPQTDVPISPSFHPRHGASPNHQALPDQAQCEAPAGSMEPAGHRELAPPRERAPAPRPP